MVIFDHLPFDAVRHDVSRVRPETKKQSGCQVNCFVCSHRYGERLLQASKDARSSFLRQHGARPFRNTWHKFFHHRSLPSPAATFPEPHPSSFQDSAAGSPLSYYRSSLPDSAGCHNVRDFLLSMRTHPDKHDCKNCAVSFLPGSFQRLFHTSRISF